MSPELSIAKPPAVIVEDEPTTPMDTAAPNGAPSASQQSLPSTEAPTSPADPDLTFKAERNDERAASTSSVIPSSLTPPPSSQVPSNNGASRAAAASLRQRMLSPPVTGLHSARPDSTPAGHYTAPRPEQVVAAPPDELRAMLQTCIAEQSRLKMEAAHHKLQYQLLSVRADEDAHRAAVEQEMTLRQLQALQQQKADAPPRPAKRAVSPSPSPNITPAMYDSLRALAEKARRDNEKLVRDYDEACKRLKAAKRLIMRQEESIDTLREDNKLLRDRLLDKRELWDKLASPGGIFHTPKTAQASPVQHRQTPRRTPKHRVDREAQPFAVLLQAATQENSSVPSTPVTPKRAAGRHPLKHSRGAQSMSSLPSTPNRSRPRGADLLPPPDLVPHTEPPRRFVSRSFVPDTPERELSFARTAGRMERGRRHSRESTISADDNEMPARATLQSLAQQATSFASRGSPPPRPRVPLPSYRGQGGGEDAQVYESQASQEATSMLRRDPRESFEVASSHGSRDVTPTPVAAEKKLQSTLRGPLNKPTVTTTTTPSAKRKLDEQAVEPPSPTKKLRMAGGLREGNPRIGLGLGIRGD